jgi:lysophospholipase L1-like esterase
MSRKLLIEPPFPSIQQLQKEGMEFAAQYNSNSRATLNAGDNITGTTWSVPFGRIGWLESFHYSTDGPVYFSFNIKEGLHAGGQLITHVFGTNGGNIVIPIRKFLYEGGQAILSGAASITGSRGYIMAGMQMFTITNDTNFNAKKRILVLGDSIISASIGNDANGIAYTINDLYPGIIRDTLLNAGKSVRLINKGLTGTTTDYLNKGIKSSYIDGIDYDLMIVGYGMNDSSGAAVSVANYTNYLKQAILHRNKFRPTASIIFVAPNQTDVSSRSTIGDYRTAMYNVANDATLGTTARKVYYYDSSTAFALNATASADTNFISGDRVAGSRTHPSAAGHQLIATGLYSVIQTTDFYNSF